MALFDDLLQYALKAIILVTKRSKQCLLTCDKIHIVEVFLGLCKTVRSQLNSNLIVVKLWKGSETLQISRDGLDC